MKKPPKEADRLRHMLDAAETAMEFVKGRQRSDLDRDEKLTLALVRLLEILGEAARHVSEKTKGLSPHIRWKEIAGTRDRLVHGYFDVDLDIVWKIITVDLPPLITELKKIISK